MPADVAGNMSGVAGPTAIVPVLELLQLRHVRRARWRGEGTTVSSVAMRDGLVYFGRSCVHYRRTYGGSPSRTLPGARRRALSGLGSRRLLPAGSHGQALRCPLSGRLQVRFPGQLVAEGRRLGLV